MTSTDIDRLVSRDHHDPHALLGAHPVDGGVVIRALHPAAESIVVQPAGVELRRLHPGGVFEGELAGASLPLDYELEIRFADGNTFTTPDPYRFAPTLSDMDEHLFREGRHEQLWSKMGAHVRDIEGVRGTSFAVWAPAARSVSVVGDFNYWDGRLHPMRALGGSGVWELFVPGVGPGTRYKYEIRAQSCELLMKADPFAFETELPPATSSIVHESTYEWNDAAYLAERAADAPHARPMSVYEVHLGSWRRNPLEDNRPLTYVELADELAAYVSDLNFTHIELMPVMAHPYTGSWGYQVTSYYAPSPRFGSPDDLRRFVDRMHEHGIGVLLDWVPAHFPRDAWALARFDGSALYEHEDPRRGFHPDWGTLVFNYGRNEVRNFLIANALFWASEFHADGIRVDAVASMLYLDYSRREGEWVPNQFGGREDLEAVSFLKELNEVLHRDEPGVISAAEESTAWPGVSRPTYLGGLGFGFKWNMGWMHDTLSYFKQDPIHRRYHHHELTFSLVYAFTENFILPLSHDEVVHGKGSLIDKMPGDRWQKLANLRSLYAYMWAHPGKKLLFMGQEFAQGVEWSHERSLDWHLLEYGEHAGIQALVRDLNRNLKDTPALYEVDFDGRGFWWIEPNDADQNVVAFARAGEDATRDVLVCICNLSPVPRAGYRVGLPQSGRWLEALNTDSSLYGGTDTGNLGGVVAESKPWHDQPASAEVTLPPLGVVWLTPQERPAVVAPPPSRPAGAEQPLPPGAEAAAAEPAQPEPRPPGGAPVPGRDVPEPPAPDAEPPAPEPDRP